MSMQIRREEKERPVEKETSRMAPEEYLDRYGVTAYMKDAIALVLENRPEDPIEFLSEYFRDVIHGSTPLRRAYRYLRLTNRNNAAFIDNVVAAYSALDSRRAGATGLVGSEFNKLIRLLCVEFPPEATQSILEASRKSDTDLVSFDEFNAIVNSCLLYEEFFEQAQKLFRVCDAGNTGRVPRAVFAACLRQYQLAQGNEFSIATMEEIEECIAHALCSTPKHTPQQPSPPDLSFKEFVLSLFQTTLPRRTDTHTTPASRQHLDDGPIGDEEPLSYSQPTD